MTTHLRAVAAAFGLGSIRSVERLAAGTMNESWKLVTTAGAYAVKRVLDVDLEATRRQSRAVRALVGKGFPAPEPLGGPDGPGVPGDAAGAADPVVVRPEGFYTAAPWVDGEHRHGTRLDLTACEALGALLGDLHGLLDATLPERSGVVEVRGRSPDQTRASLHRLLARAHEHQPAEPFDRAARDWIPVRLELLDRYADADALPAPSLQSPGPQSPFRRRWIHGDFQHTNVLWSGAEIVAVIDWDRLQPHWQAYELARAALLLFHAGEPGPDAPVPEPDPADPENAAGRVDLVRLARFVAGYRSRVGVPAEELDAAIRQRLRDELTGVWPLDAHYDRGERAPDRFFASGCARVLWCAEHADEVVDAFVGSAFGTP